MLVHRTDQEILFVLIFFLIMLFSITVISVWLTIKDRRKHKQAPDFQNHNFSEIIWIITPTLITFFMFFIGRSFCF